MEYRNLGRTGVKVSPICLGTDPFLEPTPEKECAAIINAAVEAGITAPLLGPRTLEHLEDILPVAEMYLDESLRTACDELVPPGSTVANFHNTSGWMAGKII